jgi:hypothetical protein
MNFVHTTLGLSLSGLKLRKRIVVQNPGLPDLLWAHLDGALWHATNKGSLFEIVRSGEIRVSTANRYKNSFCRQKGAISLFDFGPSVIDDFEQFENWNGWFGHQQDARVAVWLRLDRKEMGDGLIDAGSAYLEWTKDRSKTIIPGIEACHTRPISLKLISSVLLIDRFKRDLFLVVRPDFATLNQELEKFENSLPEPPPEDQIIKILRQARIAKRNGQA